MEDYTAKESVSIINEPWRRGKKQEAAGRGEKGKHA